MESHREASTKRSTVMIDQPSTLQQDARSPDEDRFNRVEETYGNEEAPLRDFSSLIVLFAVVVGGFLAFKKRSLPEKIPLSDLLLLGLATQKVSRVLTKSRVASVVRAPFTKYEGS